MTSGGCRNWSTISGDCEGRGPWSAIVTAPPPPETRYTALTRRRATVRSSPEAPARAEPQGYGVEVSLRGSRLWPIAFIGGLLTPGDTEFAVDRALTELTLGVMPNFRGLLGRDLIV